MSTHTETISAALRTCGYVPVHVLRGREQVWQHLVTRRRIIVPLNQPGTRGSERRAKLLAQHVAALQAQQVADRQTLTQPQTQPQALDASDGGQIVPQITEPTRQKRHRKQHGRRRQRQQAQQRATERQERM